MSVFPRTDSVSDLATGSAHETYFAWGKRRHRHGPVMRDRTRSTSRARQSLNSRGRSAAEAGAIHLGRGNNAEGPALVIVNLKTQKLVLFHNGVPIGASTVSSGSPGRETPTGVFTILQKRKEHYSSTYNNAPMPNMQRLTERGIALHAGKLPGYPASHGCIRLPHAFSGLLFGATNVGMTVVITDIPAVPVKSGTPAMITADAGGGQTLAKAAMNGTPSAPGRRGNRIGHRQHRRPARARHARRHRDRILASARRRQRPMGRWPMSCAPGMRAARTG